MILSWFYFTLFLVGLIEGVFSEEYEVIGTGNETAGAGGQIIMGEVKNAIDRLKSDINSTFEVEKGERLAEIADEVTEEELKKVLMEEKKVQNKILNEMFDKLLEHEFDLNITKSDKYESLVPLNKGEELSSVVVDEEFLSSLSTVDWQITMEKIHSTIWHYWNNEFHKEYVQRIPSALRQLRLVSKKMGVSSIFDEGALGDTIDKLNHNSKDADNKFKRLLKNLFIDEKSFTTAEIKYKRSEEAVINMVIELKGFIRILLKLIDIKASQVGLLLLNKVQRKSYKHLSTNLSLFKSNIKNCPVHTAFSYRYRDENFDFLMHHEKGFGIWNTGEFSSNGIGSKREFDITKDVDKMIDFVYNEFISPIALIGSSIEDISFIHSSLIRTLWKNVSTQYKIPLFTIFESISKATFFFIKQINDKIYMINNSK
ncbi:hypothetical protein HWI79_1909 [Cryptosporidium felis]|nr:hypothetical protein HWI79_1909 [Cryptosporidium felis]